MCALDISSGSDLENVIIDEQLRIDSEMRRQPRGVNFTTILWATFVPKSFCQKITNPNCKHIKAVQRTLVWLSISPIFYKQLFHSKVLCTPFVCLQFGFVIFWRKDLGAKAAHKNVGEIDTVTRVNLNWR